MTQTGTDLTIDELAQRTGQSVRNIRAHQSRGLLDPPRLAGRTGLYGPQHVERIELIAKLQADGFSLASIGRLLRSGDAANLELLDLQQALNAPFRQEEPVEMSRAELLRRFGPSPKLLARAKRLGLVVDAGRGKLVVPSVALLDGAAELRRLGVPMDRILDVAEVLVQSAQTAARAFADVFVAAVWEPHAHEGVTPERADAVRGELERLHPLASRTLTAALNQAILHEIDRVMQDLADR